MINRLENALAALKLSAQGASKEFVFDETVRVVAEALDVPFCKILEPTEDRSELVVRSGVGWEPGVVGVAKVSAKNDSQPGYALTSKNVVVFEDLSGTKRFTGAMLARRHGIVSSACLPIGDLSRPSGVLCVHDVKKRAFSREERTFLRRVAQEILHVISAG